MDPVANQQQTETPDPAQSALRATAWGSIGFFIGLQIGAILLRGKG